MVDENETVAQSAVMGAENPNWPDEPKTPADFQQRAKDRLALVGALDRAEAALAEFDEADEIEEPEDEDFDEDDFDDGDDFFGEDDEAVFDEPEEDEDAV